jgi:hypothetical protein
MNLLKIAKSGTMYYELKDGRLAAIYPDTGYVRVSYAISKNPERAKLQRQSNRAVIKEGRIGKMMKYQINPVEVVEEYHEINLPLYYKFFDREIHYNGQPWRKAYYKMDTKKRILYPNDFGKLYNMLLAFETKNCKTNV